MVTSVGAESKMTGFAELSYVKYDAQVGGSEVFSGSSLGQKYSLAYMATNLRYRSQPSYYQLKLGYDWIGFNTKVSDLNQDSNIKQSEARLRYSGEVGYNAIGLPVRVHAYLNNDLPADFRHNIASQVNLVNDGLIYDILGRGTTVASGVSFAFEPGLSRSYQLQGLPRLLLEYREVVNDNSYTVYKIHNKTKELAVAGLNKENNWIHYRTMSFENYLDPLDQYKQQQIQIGLVDNVGHRKWSLLTNWIEFSADGQLTTVQSPSKDSNREEYDVNLMAIATRKTWGARTFANYNRLLDHDSLTETTRVPVYLKGIYGRDTDWYLTLVASRGREQIFGSKKFDISYSNSIGAGLTTFKHSSFTLTPSVSMATNKSYGGADSYTLETSLETVSTKRFSNRVGLSGRVFWRTMDDGLNTARSKTWSNAVDLKGTYRASSSLSYILQNRFESGSGSGYLDPNRVNLGANINGKLGTFQHNYTLASVRWAPTAKLTTSVEGTYDYIKATNVPVSDEMALNYQIGYSNNETSYRFDSKYRRTNNNIDPASHNWKNYGEIQYKPDRYNDGLLRLTHENEKDRSTDLRRMDLLQRYTLNFFTRSGVVRNYASITEEYSFSSTAVNNLSASSQYLMLSGRYNPTERLSLYGSAKYSKGSAGEVAMYYNAGMSADFKLLTTTLDYSLARRDVDNRVEKRLAATVRRTF